VLVCEEHQNIWIAIVAFIKMVAEIVFLSFKVSNYLHQSARSIKFEVWLPVGAALVDNCLLVAFSLIPVSLFLLLIICLGSLSAHYSIDFCQSYTHIRRLLL